MAVDRVLSERLEVSFALYDELVDQLEEPSLEATLPGLPSNTIGAQLWCVVGARERRPRNRGGCVGRLLVLAGRRRHARARERATVAAALVSSAADVRRAIDRLDADDDDRARLALQLLEHEAAHHGQLIRYLYRLRLPIPASWKERYALD